MDKEGRKNQTGGIFQIIILGLMEEDIIQKSGKRNAVAATIRIIYETVCLVILEIFIIITFL